jgi:hypothetical protein
MMVVGTSCSLLDRLHVGCGRLGCLQCKQLVKLQQVDSRKCVKINV